MHDESAKSEGEFRTNGSGWSAKRICMGSAVLEGVVVHDKLGNKLFIRAVNALNKSASDLSVRSGRASKEAGQIKWGSSATLLSKAIATHLEDQKMRRLAHRTISGRKLALRQLLVAAGDIPVGHLQPDHLRKAREVIECWPGTLSKRKEYREYSDEALFALGKKLKVESPSSDTISTSRSHIACFVDQMVGEKMLEGAPMSGFPDVQDDLTEPLPKRPFTHEEIGQIFEPKAFAKWSEGNPHRWWGTLLGLFTGARVSEVAQMKETDILMEHGMWCMAYRATVDPDRVNRRHKRTRGRIKNVSSSRIFPIPPQLLDLGFLDYVDDVRAAGQTRLFPHLPSGINRLTQEDNGGTYGVALSQQFTYYLTKRIDRQPGMGFHTFRHTMPSELNDMGVIQKLIASITGHEPAKDDDTVPTLSKRYLHGKSLRLRERQREAILMFQPLLNLPRYRPGQFARAFGPDAKLYP